jgi:hypothetical protein
LFPTGSPLDTVRWPPLDSFLALGAALTLVAVVWGRENGNAAAVVHDLSKAHHQVLTATRHESSALACCAYLVAFLLHLVATNQELKVVPFEEAVGNVGAELYAGPSLAGGTSRLRLRV